VRIAVMGAGGVGGYFGARLALAGNDVTFIARGRHLDAVRREGLRIASESTPMHVAPASATDDPASIGEVDVVMFCVKLWDVEPAAQRIRPLLGSRGVAIPFQNGIDSPGLLARILGPEHVIGGIAYIAASIASPGVIRHVGTMARLRVGAFDGIRSDAAEAFVAAAKAAGIDIALAPDVRRALWEKFVFLSALSGATCLTRQPLGVIRGDARMFATFGAILHETWSVGRAQGVALPDDFVEKQLAFAHTLPHEMRASMLHDLVAGNRLEAPWLCGAIVRLGREAGVPTPVNETVYAALVPYIEGAGAADTASTPA
jgi:2-dehydropantoate 2-reductase